MTALSLVYLGYFAALGAFWPYYGPLLVSYGLSEGQATQLMAIGPVMSFIGPPLAGLIADALSARALLLRLLSAGAVVSFGGFFLAAELPWVVVPTVVIFSACRSPLISLFDASALAVARREGSSYGRMRLWGSLGFLGAALVAAELAGRSGPRGVLPESLGLMALAAIAAWFIPAAPGERGPILGAWLERLRHPEMWLFSGATALGACAHALYDAGFSLHLQHLGLGGRFIGIAWAVGVGFEVALMAISGRLLARFPAERLYTFALAVGSARWLLLAHVTSPAVLLVLQPLHAVTFGLCWIAGVNIAHARGSPRAPTAAQGLYGASVAAGAFVGISLSGRLLAAWGGRDMFLLGAGLAAVATVLAALLARSPPGEGRAGTG